MGQTWRGTDLAAWPGWRLERRAPAGETDRGAGTEADAAWRRLGGVAGRGEEAMKLECGMEAGLPMGLDVKRCGVGPRRGWAW